MILPFLFSLAHDQAGLNKSISSEQLIVDTTPPFSGHIRCSSLTASKWFGGNVLNIHLTDFYDDESGIDFYSISVGSHYHTADVLQQTTYRQDLIDINLDDAHMTDGHTYYLGVKVCNALSFLDILYCKILTMYRSIFNHACNGYHNLYRKI